MGDHVILRFPLDDPDNPEVVDVLANVPVHWQKYLKDKANEHKKPGRYIVSNLLYDEDTEYYYPESIKKKHRKTEKDSE